MEKSNQLGWPELLVLVRHAESLRNRAKKHNIYFPDEEEMLPVRGIPDHRIPLTDRGHHQALATGPHLRSKFGLFDVVYDSGYLRTIETRIQALRAYAPEEVARMKLRTDPYVAERFPGYTWNMTTRQAEKYFPYLKEHWEMYGPFYGVPPGGKSQFDVCKDVHTFIGHIRRIRAGQKVLVFTHGGTIRAFRYNIERWTPDQYMDRYNENPPGNCGITAYRFHKETGRMELSEYNTVYWTEEAVA